LRLFRTPYLKVIILSDTDPQTGAAGSVAIKSVRGRFGEQDGSFALQQFG
jgi:hypothetical protein